MGVLDAHQQAAVDHSDGPAIVLAGPGSGKTKVIVERAARLLTDPADPHLLVLTFSRKAAEDLRQRLAAHLRRSYASFPVTTFHAFCLAVLTNNAPEPPRLARDAERRRLAAAALAAENDLGLRASNALTQEALRFAELCDDYLGAPDHPLTSVREHYIVALAERGALDFGGLQREAIALLEQNEELRRAYAAQFRHVLVDEYQDTNIVQERLLELIAGEHRNVFCVADEDQSIYGFRGAEIENALGFQERWKGATRYDLPTNYRSAPAIVELAASVIRRNVDTHLGKALVAADDRPGTLVGETFRHAAEEADWIAREVAALRLEGVELGQITVLARSLKEIGPRLAYSLRSHGIAFHAPLAPQLHPSAEALLSLLELAVAYPWEPHHNAQALHALASPLFAADSLELRRFRREPRTLYGALKDSGDFAPFFEALGIVKRQKTAGAAIYALWERLDHFRTLQIEEATRDQIEELAAVTALSDAANEFDGEPAAFTVAFRRGDLELDEPPAGPLPRDAVALLTIHQAKGLEWEAVFVCDLVEGRFPALARSQYALFDREDFARTPLEESVRARRALEEERRLFYVAITRARSRLCLTATEEAREESGRALSRFYLEAQQHLAEGTAHDGFVSADEALAALRRAGGGPPGWRDLTETENAHPMLPEGALWTSASGLGPYENCPLQFYLGTMLELMRPSGPALVFGATLHDVLEDFHDPVGDPDRSRARLLALGEKHWREGVIRPAPLEVEHRRRLKQMLTDYHALEIAPGLDGEVLAVERRFRVELEGATLSGRIDRIDRRPDGTLSLLDYKSSKKGMSTAEAEADLQLALYGLACGLDEELKALGRVAELVYVYPRHIAHGRIARRSQPVTADLEERTRARVRGLVEAVIAERFDFSPEADCGFCDFKHICPRHVRNVPL